MANTPNVLQVAGVGLIASTFIEQAISVPNQMFVLRRIHAQPFFGTSGVSGDTPTTAVQLWPTKL